MKPFSIYFPQFYPTPTNDKVWGKGFTDWSLIANANLHDVWSRRAPKRGYYNGGDPRVHAEQIEEMKAHGLGGMGVYHYWFYSHQELGAFEGSLLTSGSNLPWFLIWASEGWTRRWLGDPTTIVALTNQPTLPQVQLHCDHLAKCFDSPNYFCMEGRPVFVWYNLSHFSSPGDVVAMYRDCFHKMGINASLGHFVKNPFDVQYSRHVDFTYLFEPRLFFGMQRRGRGPLAKRAFDGLFRLLGESAASRLLLITDRMQAHGKTHFASDFLRYLSSDARQALVDRIGGPCQEVLTPGWNNAPRYAERYTALQDLDPVLFAGLVEKARQAETSLPPLINAWNEWSEGAAIEPCEYYGTRYLEKLNAVLEPPGMVSPVQSRGLEASVVK